ncbi:MAG: hypothetical protein KatS3mg102_0402 [Planctomycetota bacterium]|nr:MAG: hypothetical protein KatS3mg102_0402 [Planctomycetota bacterium]
MSVRAALALLAALCLPLAITACEGGGASRTSQNSSGGASSGGTSGGAPLGGTGGSSLGGAGGATAGGSGGASSGGSSGGSAGGSSGGSTSGGGLVGGGSGAGTATGTGAGTSAGSAGSGAGSGGSTGSTGSGSGAGSGGSASGTGTGAGNTAGGGSGAGSTSGSGFEAIEVTAQALNVRQGPGTSHPVIEVIHRGEVYAAFESQGGWKRIWFDDGPGWVSASHTRTTSHPVVVVTATRLNVRTGPGTSYQRLGELVQHSLRVQIGTSGSWTRTWFAGREGWCASQYLRAPRAADLAATIAAANAYQRPAGGSGAGAGHTGNAGGSQLRALEVTASALNVRAGPGTQHAVLGIAHAGEVYAAFDVSGEWRRIWFSERAGWVHENYVREVNQPVLVVTASVLNVRAGAGTSHPVIGQLVRNSLRVRTGSSGDWTRTSFDGRTAWVHSGYLAAPGSGSWAATVAAADGTGSGSSGGNAGSSSGNGGGSSGGSSAGGTSGTSGSSATLIAYEITASALNVREGPGTSHRVLGLAHQGETYAAFQQNSSWARIWFDNGPGWVSRSYLRASSLPVQRVTASLLNVRSGPGTSYARIGQLPQHAVVVVRSSSGSWRQISFDGRTAWVHGNYLAAASAGQTAQTIAAADAFATGGNQAVASGGGSSGSGANPQNLPRSQRGFLQMPASGRGYYSYAVPARRWGRDYFVYGILRVGSDWAGSGYGRMGVGDLSLENGGPISGHVSHQKGVDADVRPVKRSGEGPVTIHQSAYSRAGTQALIDLYYRHLPVTLVLFNDPHVRRVRWWQNHDNHFHVRVVER